MRELDFLVCRVGETTEEPPRFGSSRAGIAHEEERARSSVGEEETCEDFESCEEEARESETFEAEARHFPEAREKTRDEGPPFS